LHGTAQLLLLLQVAAAAAAAAAVLGQDGIAPLVLQQLQAVELVLPGALNGQVRRRHAQHRGMRRCCCVARG
jgi:hypothetical protein